MTSGFFHPSLPINVWDIMGLLTNCDWSALGTLSVLGGWVAGSEGGGGGGDKNSQQ